MDLQEARQTLLRETPLTTSESTPHGLHEQFFERTIALFLIAVLFFACVQITAPFLGVLGGLIAWGFLGIFLGATLLAIGYTVLRSWLDQAASTGADS